ncbi:FecR family protein [Arenibacter sp. M-2]|uniref:FecR family protein n=1 Tax=Arenibacter sp. M-2 TaxID=3053612 RepID=UPI0025712152|nr:FecR family protein [Arenibacter sp. M-2]MDL5511279.1 FecR family protein [Arenibacter sp. M-2]
MISNKIQRLITQYVTKQASDIELEDLESWLENPKNYSVFKRYLKINYLIDLTMDLFDSENSKKELLDLIKKEKRVNRLYKFFNTMKYAAAVALFIGIIYTVKNGYLIEKPKLLIPANVITLQLENGNIEVLHEDGTTKIIDVNGKVVGNQSGNQLRYDSNTKIEKIVYNTLTVPNGKRFEVQLSDGTNVYLNAGTSLRYPVKFIQNNKREVFVTGEAFFDVAPDREHPFIVNADSLNIEVLGTEFNVTAYPEDLSTDVVLVEGSVGMYMNNKTMDEGMLIEPGTKGSLNKNLETFTSELVDTSLYTLWMDGDLVFRNMPFRNIARKLERRFNITIIIKNYKLNDEVFNATFKEGATIQNILHSFKNSFGLDYTIKDSTVYIN